VLWYIIINITKVVYDVNYDYIRVINYLFLRILYFILLCLLIINQFHFGKKKKIMILKKLLYEWMV